MKKPFIILAFFSSLMMLMFLGCEKNKASKNYEREVVLETVQFLKKDTFYIRLALTYSPEIIAKRVIAKGNVLDSVGYINEFNSLNSLRAYYYYQLQNRFNTFPAAIKNHVKKEYSSFFSVKIENITVPRSVIYQECPSGLVFNSVLEFCDWPENVEDGLPCYYFDDEEGLYYPVDDCEAAKKCDIESNLNITAGTFIGKCCNASIWSEFPGGQSGTFKDKLVSDIKQNKSTTNEYQTAWKLISRLKHRE